MNIHFRSVHTTAGAVAATASIISGLVGVIQLFVAPHGVHRLAVALHIAQQPLLARIAPFVTAFAVVAAALAALMRLYHWRRDNATVGYGPPGNHA